MEPSSLPKLSTFISPTFDIFDYAASHYQNRFDILPVVAMAIFDDVLETMELVEEKKRWGDGTGGGFIKSEEYFIYRNFG